MLRMFMSTTPLLATGAAALAIALGAPASAAPEQCTNSAETTVCQQPGSSDITARPPQDAGGGQTGGGANEQNGSYGPAGDLPPVGN
jgi:hypothetical protein